MMTRPTRHRAGRTQTAHPDSGLPGPGQALIGYPEPERSLFGVPQSAVRDATWPPIPPRPRTPQDDVEHRRPRRQRPRQSWAQRLWLPLAVAALGLALGVITLVMLVAAGISAP